MDWCCKIIKKNRKGAFHRVSMCFTICNFAGIEVLAISFNVAVKHIETGFVWQFGRRHVPLPSVLKLKRLTGATLLLRRDDAGADFVILYKSISLLLHEDAIAHTCKCKCMYM